MSCNRPRAPLCLRAGIPEAGRRAVPSRVPVHLQRHMGGARTTAPPPPEGSAGGPPLPSHGAAQDPPAAVCLPAQGL